MGGAQPLAATFAGACSLNIECQQSRIDFRLRTRYLDEQASDLDDALARIATHTREKKAVSIGLLGNAAEIAARTRASARRRAAPKPDLVTDQTSAHDLVNGYLPAGWSVEGWRAAQADADAARRAARRRGEELRGARAGDARLPGDGRADGRLRQQHPPGRVRPRRRQRVRLPRLRAGVHPAAVLPRQGAVPLGRAVAATRKTSARPTRS